MAIPPSIKNKMNTGGLTMKTYTFIGSIKSGNEIFYCPDDKSLAIEKDHTFLAKPTPEEAAQVYKIFPNLKPHNQIATPPEMRLAMTKEAF
jgi:hypothetical protein